MVLEKIRKGLRPEPPVVAQLHAHQWVNDAQKKDLVEKFLALPSPDLDDLVWTATDPNPDIRAAGLSQLKRRADRATLDALVPLLRTRSEAQRRAVQRFIQELAGPELSPFLMKIAEEGDDFARVAALELARNLPTETAYHVFKKVLQDPNPALRSRALKAVGESTTPGTAALAANLALPMLQDEDEEIRLAALSVLERNPSEALISHVLELARSGGGRVADAAFSALRRLLPTAQADHSAEILPLLADGNAGVRTGGVSLLERLPPDILARRFLETFHSSFVWVRDRALETAVQGLPNFLVALLRLTQDQQPETARAAAEMTLNVPDTRAIPVWLTLVGDPDWWIRHRALEALGKYGKGDDRAFGAIHASLVQDSEMLLSAAGALGDLGDPRAAGPLFEAFKAAAERPDDQLELLDALARLGPVEPRVGPVLAKIASLATLDTKVREKARRLYGKLQGEGARDALPPIAAAPKLHEFGEGATRLIDFLSDTVARNASDFHIATGFVPHRRINGILEPLNVPRVTPEQAHDWVREVLSDDEWLKLERDKQIDLCVKVAGLGRFRANFFSQRAGYDASFRVIPKEIPVLGELGLPDSIFEVTRYTQGLVLVTGPAGCGKSTTLAALLDRVNETRRGHIITVEDPVEFVHANKECLVNQRQVPTHTTSFARALKAALREDPDVIMIGEMRDLETISLAITASETGHLVLGTLHTTTAPGTIDRLINAFPPGQQGQIRAMIADSLKAVISQALLPRRGGFGRIAAYEILRGTPAVSALIREAKTFQLPSALQTGGLAGMNTMDQALMKLVEEGKVDPQAALDRAVKKEPFEKYLAEERQALA